MVRQDRLTQKINPEVLRLMSKLLIDPDFAMVIVSTGDRIVAKQKSTAAPCDS